MTTPTPDEICERLRAWARFGLNRERNKDDAAAADLIQQQQATIERLSAEKVELAAMCPDGIEGIGASYFRNTDEWTIYTMPGAKTLAVVKGFDRRRLDWIVGALRHALGKDASDG
jgi:hypothetical protein